MTDSRALLTEYIKTGSELAFRELVDRYIGLVYSTALRLVSGDEQSAQDVVQTVFIHLARKASNIATDAMLGGWLHRDACNVAAKLIRSECRRQARERQAMELSALEDHTPANLARIAPILDEAINQLNAEDRTAILLRFFEQRDLCSVGAALGSSEDAARMRVNRALEKLQLLLRKRDVGFSTTALAAVLATEAVTAAPVSLATNVAGTALASVATAGTATATVLKFMTLTKLKLAVGGGLAVAALAAPLVVQHQSQARLREENQSLNLQPNRLGRLATENERLSNLLAQADSTRTLSSDQLSELLRLRSEVGRLRQEGNETKRLRQENAQLRSAWAHGGSGAGTTSAANTNISQLYTHSIKVNADSLLQQMRGSTAGAAEESKSQVVRDFLRDHGIAIEPPAAVFLSETNGTLHVRAPQAHLDKIEQLLTSLAVAAEQQGLPSPLSSIAPEKASAARKVQEGRLSWQAGKLDEAEATLKEAINEDPANQAAYFYLNLVKETRYKNNP